MNPPMLGALMAVRALLKNDELSFKCGTSIIWSQPMQETTSTAAQTQRRFK